MQIVTDRYYYFSGLFIIFAAAITINHIGKRLPYRPLLTFTFILYLASMASATNARLAVWRDDISLMSESISRYPNNPNSAIHYNIRCNAKITQKDYLGAYADLDQAIRLDPRLASRLNNQAVKEFLEIKLSNQK